jgi:hypothetical protein
MVDQAAACNPQDECCARRVLGAQKDFQDQKGLLQEEVENLSHRVLFTPNFTVNSISSNATSVSSEIVCQGKL